MKALRAPASPVVAVFGGSFNPLHEGHLGIVHALAADADVERVIVVPARRSPFKRDAALLPDAVRWNMLRHALAGEPRVCVSDIELRRPPPSYTVDTLYRLAALLPAAHLCFALGWDAFAEFAGWYHATDILAVAGLIVFDRAGKHRAAPADPAEWAPLLPPPWDGRAFARDGQRLMTRDGRPLVRHLPLELPEVAARDILSGQSLEGVPPGAREVLAAYWRQAGPA